MIILKEAMLFLFLQKKMQKACSVNLRFPQFAAALGLKPSLSLKLITSTPCLPTDPQIYVQNRLGPHLTVQFTREVRQKTTAKRIRKQSQLEGNLLQEKNK